MPNLSLQIHSLLTTLNGSRGAFSFCVVARVADVNKTFTTYTYYTYTYLCIASRDTLHTLTVTHAHAHTCKYTNIYDVFACIKRRLHVYDVHRIAIARQCVRSRGLTTRRGVRGVERFFVIITSHVTVNFSPRDSPFLMAANSALVT